MRRKNIRGWPTPSEHLAFVMGVVPGVACVSDVAARDHDGEGDGDKNSDVEHASWCRTLARRQSHNRDSSAVLNNTGVKKLEFRLL